MAVLLHDDALILVGHVDDHLLEGLQLLASLRVLPQEHLRRAHHELEALPAHVLHQNAQPTALQARISSNIPAKSIKIIQNQSKSNNIIQKPSVSWLLRALRVEF